MGTGKASRPLKPPRRIDATGLFAPDRRALVRLLDGLSPSDWALSTACSGWDVRDVALHVLGGDLANIAGRRDGYWGLQPASGESLGAFINRINEQWVASARRLSPRLIVELLSFTGPLLFEHLSSLDLDAIGEAVSWAGPGPAPVWLDVAREYMERWVHQQHIRDAVGRPGQTQAGFVAPVIAASMHALPVALEPRREGALVIEVLGDGGGVWTVAREAGRWTLLAGRAPLADAVLSVQSRDWWRLVTLGLTPAAVASRARVDGDSELAQAALGAVAIIA